MSIIHHENGRIACNIPIPTPLFTPAGREKHFGQDDHVRLYGSDFYQRLQDVGFTTHIYKKHDFFNEEENKRLSLAIEKELVIVRK